MIYIYIYTYVHIYIYIYYTYIYIYIHILTPSALGSAQGRGELVELAALAGRLRAACKRTCLQMIMYHACIITRILIISITILMMIMCISLSLYIYTHIDI